VKNAYNIEETGVMLYSMPQGSFDLYLAWIGNSFRVVVKNATSGEIIFLRVYNFQNAVTFKDAASDLKSIVATDVLFADTYHNIRIGLAGRAELMPSMYYSKPTNEFFAQKLTQGDITAFLLLNHEEMEFYSAFFPKATYTILSAAWLELLLPKAEAHKLFVHVSHHTLWVAYAENKEKINFFSTFEFKAAEDFAYYTNLVAVELKMDRTKTTIVLSGDLTKDSALQKMAYTYFQQVVFFEETKASFSRLFDNYPRHQNIDLFSL
jgi:hypothetical protein